jgi:hypothetical protein
MLTGCLALFCLGCEDNAAHDDYNRGGDIPVLAITPQEVTLSTNNSFASFTASGGTAPYRWEISDETLGTIPSNVVAEAVTYTVVEDTYGVNVLTVLDANDWSAAALIYQTNQVENTTTNSTSS